MLAGFISMRALNRLVVWAVLCVGPLAACQSDPPEAAVPPPIDASTSVSADTGIAELGVPEIGVADAAQHPVDQGQADIDAGYCPPFHEGDECWMGIEPNCKPEEMDCLMDAEEGTLLSKSNCGVDYPGADPCYQCVIERCCRWSQCASGGAKDARFGAAPGEDLWARWREYIVPPALDPGIDWWRYSWPHSIHVACVRDCIEGSPPDAPNASSAPARLTACVEACVDLVVPDCDNDPDPARHRYWYPYRRFAEEFMACLFTGPEGNATLNHPNDLPYPRYLGENYVPRFADTSCAAVCFGAEP
jgi:hypothetical protein